MADLAITTIGLHSADAVVRVAAAGATLGAGVPVYQYTNPSANPDVRPGAAGNATVARVVGLTLTPGAAGGFVSYAAGGDVDFGATTLAVNKIYVLSHNTGKICPIDDHTTSGDVLTIIGFGLTASVMRLLLVPTGNALP